MKYEEWLQMDETLSFKRKVKDRLEDIKEDWSLGSYTGETIDRSIQKNSEQIGYAKACYDVIESLTEKEDEIESEGVQGSY